MPFRFGKSWGYAIALEKEKVSDMEVEEYVMEGARKAVGRPCQLCKSKKSLTGAEKEALKACRISSAKTALKNSLGEENVTNTESKYLSKVEPNSP